MESAWRVIILLVVTVPVIKAEFYRTSTMSALMNDRTHKQMGAQIKGVQLDEIEGTDLAGIFARNVYDQRMLIFKNQELVDDEDFKDIALAFGTELDESHTQHPRAQEKAVMPLSNDKKLGVTIKDGHLWHVGGFGYEKPYSISLFRVSKYGKDYPFVFVPLDDIVESLPPEKKEQWDRIWIRTGTDPKVVHPLIYHHPITTAETMCFDMESMYELIYDYGTEQQRVASAQELDDFQTDLMNTMLQEKGVWHYHHKWEEGDVILIDSQSVGQLYLPATHLQQDAVGVFRVHRINIMGDHVPTKAPGTPKPPNKKVSHKPWDDDEDDDFDEEDIDIEDGQGHYKMEL